MEPGPSPDMASTAQIDPWGTPIEYAVCESCGWRFVLPSGNSPARCPHCFKVPLAPFQESHESDFLTAIPELVTPHDLAKEKLASQIASFTSGIPFAPADLKTVSLLARMQRVYLPVWLVDAQVSARWRMEVGYDYQVVSHQDRYDERRTGWVSQEIKENRIRWEPRLGQLNRTYQNILAPSLEREKEIPQNLGETAQSQTVAYAPEHLHGAFVRLPERSRMDAWTDAVAAIQALAARDCQEASGANHSRVYHWQPQFTQQGWTLLLHPAYSTYYLDDQGAPLTVMIDGISGRVTGSRQASMQRARRASTLLLLAAGLLFVLGLALAALGTIVPPLIGLGGTGILVSVVIGLGALIPWYVAWQFNHANQPGVAHGG